MAGAARQATLAADERARARLRAAVVRGLRRGLDEQEVAERSGCDLDEVRAVARDAPDLVVPATDR